MHDTFKSLNKAFIKGEWIAASDESVFDVVDPANQKVIAQVSDCGAVEATRAVEAAHIAFEGWANTSPSKRSRILRKIGDLLIEQAPPLSSLLTAENGKPLKEAYGEILYGASYFHWFSEEANRIYGDVLSSTPPQSHDQTYKAPIGVCAAITPWNFPNAMLARKAAAAFSAGCTLVAKPSEDTPLSALALGLICQEAGLPDGVFNIVPSSNADSVGKIWTSEKRVKKLSFTGSTQVGRKLYSQCAPTLKRLSMELGGNAPFIVFDDADIDQAISGLMGAKFRNAGQACISANRVFVHSSIHSAFVDELKSKLNALIVGPGTMETTNIGPLINGKAIAKIERLISDAKTASAKLIVGGKQHSAGPLFFQPTLISEVKPTMDIAKEEIFGPVISVISFDEEKEVIAMANDTEHGLAAYFYTQNLARSFRVSNALEFGMVGINDSTISSSRAPFGGINQSGFGREGSKYGMDDYLEVKYRKFGIS